MTQNRSLRIALVTGVVGFAGLAFSAPAMAAPDAGSVARPAAVQTAVDTPPTPVDLRVDQVTRNSVTFESDNPALPPQDRTCTLPVYLYYVYVNGTDIGSTYPSSPVGVADDLQPHTTYQLQLQRQDICNNARSALSAPLTVTTLG